MILECIELGGDVLDHADDIDEQCIDAMASAGTFWVPSLIYPKCLLELGWGDPRMQARRSEEHTSELQSLMRISYAVFCLKKKNKNIASSHTTHHCSLVSNIIIRVLN